MPGGVTEHLSFLFVPQNHSVRWHTGRRQSQPIRSPASPLRKARILQILGQNRAAIVKAMGAARNGGKSVNFKTLLDNHLKKYTAELKEDEDALVRSAGESVRVDVNILIYCVQSLAFTQRHILSALIQTELQNSRRRATVVTIFISSSTNIRTKIRSCMALGITTKYCNVVNCLCYLASASIYLTTESIPR